MDGRKLMVAGAVAGSLGLGSVIGAVVFTPGVGLAGSPPADDTVIAFCPGGSELIDAAAEAIGIEPSELVDALRNGQTIAEVARANDVEVASVVDAIVASERERLDQAVEDGRLTRDQADEIATDLEERVTDLVNGELAPFPFLGAPPLRGSWPGPIGLAADAIGIEPAELLAALADGQTIADVARANDVEVASVVDAIVAAARERLDLAVENGWLTQDQADARAADLEERVTELVNGELPAFPGPGGWHGERPGWPGGPFPPPFPPDGGGSEEAADLSLL